jgi:hypothetical protein
MKIPSLWADTGWRATPVLKTLLYVLPPEAGRQLVVPAGRPGQILRRAVSTNDSRPSGPTDAQVFSSFVVPLASGMTNSEARGRRIPFPERSFAALSDDSPARFLVETLGCDPSLFPLLIRAVKQVWSRWLRLDFFYTVPCRS